MKFDDSDKDYFLHNFDGDDSSSRQPSDAPSRPQSVSSDTGERNSPSFNFGETPQTRPSVKPRKRRHGWLWFFLIIAVLLGVTVYVRYFVPYVTESRTSGYVTLVEKRGIVFPTFEGEMASESLLNDTSRVYTRDVYFSIPNDSLALQLQKFQGSGRPVTITCKRYYGTLPWRGASNTVLVGFTPGL